MNRLSIARNAYEAAEAHLAASKYTEETEPLITRTARGIRYYTERPDDYTDAEIIEALREVQWCLAFTTSCVALRQLNVARFPELRDSIYTGQNHDRRVLRDGAAALKEIIRDRLRIHEKAARDMRKLLRA